MHMSVVFLDGSGFFVLILGRDYVLVLGVLHQSRDWLGDCL